MTFTLMLFIVDEYERMLTVSQTFMRRFAAPCRLTVEGVLTGMVISMIVHRKV